MTRFATALALLVILAGGAGFAGAASANKTSNDQATKKVTKATRKSAKAGEVTVDQLALLLNKKEVTVVDANGTDTRQKQGKIPGAILLSHFEKYDLAELPAAKDTKLVFYCANTHCGASHKGAEKAMLAGYTDVSVLPAGIAGWREAGKDVETVQ